MLNQEFTAKEFSYLVKRGDYFTYFKNDNKEEKTEDLRKELLQYVADNWNSCANLFSTLKTTILKGKTTYILEKIKKDNSNLKQRLIDDFVLRKVNKNLRRTYGVRQSDRYKIIKNVKSLLSENSPFYVCKTDIKHFYETINRDKILSDIRSSSILSFDTKFILEQFFSNELFHDTQGLPRGINISATLSEYFMRYFDKEIRKICGVYYYARFVDDIIIFSTKEITKSTLKQISELLPKGLALNLEKTNIVKFHNKASLFLKDKLSITFLGYQFFKYAEKNKKHETKIKIKTVIAPQKIKKIKERLIKTFIAFSKHKDIKLLKDRLLFLSANYPIKSMRQEITPYDKIGYLHGGIAYNYPLIDDTSCLKELDTFLFQLINTTAFSKINNTFTPGQRKELQKYSFYAGYQRRIKRMFNFNRRTEIVECWSE